MISPSSGNPVAGARGTKPTFMTERHFEVRDVVRLHGVLRENESVPDPLASLAVRLLTFVNYRKDGYGYAAGKLGFTRHGA